MADKGRLVITGASGFIGFRLVKMALAQGWSVTALARNQDRLAKLSHPRLRIAHWSIEHPQRGLEFFAGADAVCHLAAFIPPDHSDPGYAEQCFRTNALGSFAAARLALDANVRRFLLFSSGQSYAFSEKPATEEDPLYPTRRATFYLSSKIAAELFVQTFSPALPTTIFRLASVYGPDMKGGVIEKFLKNIREEALLIVHDGGRHHVDLIHVDDVATAALLAIERNADGIFNIGSGRAVSMLTVAQAMARLFDLDPQCIELLPASDSRPAGFAALDIRKARERLGFAPMQLAEGLSSLRSTPITVGPMVESWDCTADEVR